MLLFLACTADVTGDSPKAPDSGAGVDSQVDTMSDSPGGDSQGGDSEWIDTQTPDSPPVETGDSLPVDTEETAVEPEAVPDFLLADVNPNSPRYGEMISPRDYIGQVAGFYFTHAT